MADQHDELDRLLGHARADAPSEHVLGEVRQRVISSLAAGATSAAPAAVTFGRVRSSWALKLIVGGIALGLVLAAYFALRPAPASREPVRAPETSAQPAPRPIEAIAPRLVPPAIVGPAPESPIVEPAPKPHRVARRAQAPAAQVEPAKPPATNASFAEEVALIKAALDAQREGRADEARAKLEDHARRFPAGQLVNERKRIEARLGDKPQ